MAGRKHGYRSVFDGVLNSLFQTPPWQKLQQHVDGAQGERIKAVPEFLLMRLSKQLWRDNWQRYKKYAETADGTEK